MRGLAKRQFSGFRHFANKLYRRKWAWPMQKDATDSSESMCIFDCGRFGVGVIAPNAFSEHSIGQLGDILFSRFFATPCGEFFQRQFSFSK